MDRTTSSALLFAFQLLLLASAVSASTTGRFAVVKRFQNCVESANSVSCALPFYRRSSSINSCESANYNSNHVEFQTDSDSDRIQEGRFAMEYDHERPMMRSAENAHVQQNRILEHSDANTINNMSRNQRRPTFVHPNNDPIFV